MQNWEMPSLSLWCRGIADFSLVLISYVESAVRPCRTRAARGRASCSVLSGPSCPVLPSSCLLDDSLGMFWVVGQRLTIVILGTIKIIFWGI